MGTFLEKETREYGNAFSKAAVEILHPRSSWSIDYELHTDWSRPRPILRLIWGVCLVGPLQMSIPKEYHEPMLKLVQDRVFGPMVALQSDARVMGDENARKVLVDFALTAKAVKKQLVLFMDNLQKKADKHHCNIDWEKSFIEAYRQFAALMVLAASKHLQESTVALVLPKRERVGAKAKGKAEMLQEHKEKRRTASASKGHSARAAAAKGKRETAAEVDDLTGLFAGMKADRDSTLSGGFPALAGSVPLTPFQGMFALSTAPVLATADTATFGPFSALAVGAGAGARVRVRGCAGAGARVRGCGCGSTRPRLVRTVE